MSEGGEWTAFDATTGLVVRHYGGWPGPGEPPAEAGEVWKPGRWTKGSWRLVDGEVAERPPVPHALTGTPVADGETVLLLDGLPEGTRLDMIREEGVGATRRAFGIHAGTLPGTSAELVFTEPGTYRLTLVKDPEHRPTTLLIEVPLP